MGKAFWRGSSFSTKSWPASRWRFVLQFLDAVRSHGETDSPVIVVCYIHCEQSAFYFIILLLPNCSSCYTQVMVDQKNRDEQIIQLATTTLNLGRLSRRTSRPSRFCYNKVTECALSPHTPSKRTFVSCRRTHDSCRLLIYISRDSDGEMHLPIAVPITVLVLPSVLPPQRAEATIQHA
jgi:hypothetical protein